MLGGSEHRSVPDGETLATDLLLKMIDGAKLLLQGVDCSCDPVQIRMESGCQRMHQDEIRSVV